MALASIVPMLPVHDLAASVAFYRQLGFEVQSLREDWGWASITLGAHRVMLDRSIASGVHACRNAVVYLYADDLDQFWGRAGQAGLALPEIGETFYGMREFRVLDPSGNQIWVGQARAQPASTMRTLLTALAFVVILAVGTPALLFALLVVVGPHSDFLPGWAALPVTAAGAAGLLTLAILGARQVWRRFGQSAAA